MKNVIDFKRGNSPKKGLGLGIEVYKEKYNIFVLNTDFKDIVLAANHIYSSKQFGIIRQRTDSEISYIKKFLEAHFVIIENGKEFRIIKSRIGPINNEMIPSNYMNFVENCNYPIKDLNKCIMWMSQEAEKWEKR